MVSGWYWKIRKKQSWCWNKAQISIQFNMKSTQKNYEFLFEQGVAAIFGPGTNIPLAAQEIVTIMLDGIS